MTTENPTMNERMYFLLRMGIFQCQFGFLNSHLVLRGESPTANSLIPRFTLSPRRLQLRCWKEAIKRSNSRMCRKGTRVWFHGGAYLGYLRFFLFKKLGEGESWEGSHNPLTRYFWRWFCYILLFPSWDTWLFLGGWLGRKVGSLEFKSFHLDSRVDSVSQQGEATGVFSAGRYFFFWFQFSLHWKKTKIIPNHSFAKKNNAACHAA